MKRWFVLLLVGLAVIILLSPGIIGRLAEENIDRGLSQVDMENENISIRAEAFERGWFTSEGRHRILLEGGTLFEIVEGYNYQERYAGNPALIIDTRVDHGLLPISSLQRERGSLNPALANAVSTIRLDRGDGQLVDLPGRVYGFIGLGGNSSFRFLMDEGSDVSGNTSTRWSGADITWSVSADGLTRTIEGNIEPATIESFDVETTIGETAFRFSQDRHLHRLGEVALDVDLESLKVRSPGAEDVTAGPLRITLDSRIEGGRTSADGRLALVIDNVPDLGSLDVAADVGVGNLDAEALATMIDAYRILNGLGSNPGEAELASVYPALERAGERLAARGGSLRIENARASVPQGDWQMDLSVEVDETADGAQPFSWPSALLKTSAILDLRMSESLFEYLVVMNPDLRAAVAGGFLLKKGDGYELSAELDDGRLVLNGAPMNLPLALPQ